MELNPKIPNESEEFYSGILLGISSSSPVGYRGEELLSVGPGI